jgi:hypothetical protein
MQTVDAKLKIFDDLMCLVPEIFLEDLLARLVTQRE